MDNNGAFKLALDLRRERRSVMRLRADVEGDRIVFSGGRQGPHSLAIDVSTPCEERDREEELDQVWRKELAENEYPR